MSKSKLPAVIVSDEHTKMIQLILDNKDLEENRIKESNW